MSTAECELLQSAETSRPLTEDEAAEYLKVPITALRRLRSRGLGPDYVMVGPWPRYTMTSILRFLAGGHAETGGKSSRAIPESK